MHTPSLLGRRAAFLSCSGLALVGATIAAADDWSWDEDTVLRPDSLVISSTTYDRSRGAVASLRAGTTLPGSATATSQAVAANDYVNVWNNDAVDPSFGVTSAIRLSIVEPRSGRLVRSIRVPSDQVVTSFPSKSELGLHLAADREGLHLVFIAYAGPDVGALDASNADAVPGQDPSNPVTFAFGPHYAFHRTIVSMNETGRFSYTPTIAYGGNNGRSALLGSTGLYYAVGNANNGDASTFGAANGTAPDVTQTSGVEVIEPLNARIAGVSPAASAEVDPMLQFSLGKNGGLDKAGKDNNYRGLTEYRGALYFTKGSGSNGIDTVYTVNALPTLGNAAAQVISVVPGFPTDSARATGGDYTPFAVFFANATTMYVTDEGSGSSLDATQHAGLQKWSLVNATWQLDYVLMKGVIGVVDTNLFGYDGRYPDVTTTGLRNLTGTVNGDGTVTLWATTATSSASGDNGADPNKVVRITDTLSDTTLTGRVAAESFDTIAGPTYGTVYRGVAYVDGHCRPSGSDHDECGDHHRR